MYYCDRTYVRTIMVTYLSGRNADEKKHWRLQRQQ